MAWKASGSLMDTIRHYASFPATGVSLRQMVQFGEKPSIGMSMIRATHAIQALGALLLAPSSPFFPIAVFLSSC